MWPSRNTADFSGAFGVVELDAMATLPGAGGLLGPALALLSLPVLEGPLLEEDATG